MTLAERLEQELKKRNMTKIELSQLTGVKKSTIYNIFNEVYDVKLETLRTIAEGLNVSIDYLVMGDESKNKQAEKPEILKLYELMSPLEQERLLAYAEGIVKLRYGIGLTEPIDFAKLEKLPTGKNML